MFTCPLNHDCSAFVVVLTVVRLCIFSSSEMFAIFRESILLCGAPCHLTISLPGDSIVTRGMHGRIDRRRRRKQSDRAASVCTPQSRELCQGFAGEGCKEWPQGQRRSNPGVPRSLTQQQCSRPPVWKWCEGGVTAHTSKNSYRVWQISKCWFKAKRDTKDQESDEEPTEIEL